MSNAPVPCPDRGRSCGSPNHRPENTDQINACAAAAMRRAFGGEEAVGPVAVWAPPSATTTAASEPLQGTKAVDPEDLNDLMQFDHVIRVHEDGSVSEPEDLFYTEDLIMDGEIQGSDWEFASTGYSGQDRYDGPIMHNSEYIGGSLAEDILDKPGTYVTVIARYTPDVSCKACGSQMSYSADEEPVDDDGDQHCSETGGVHDVDPHDLEVLERGAEEEGWAVVRLTDEAEAKRREEAEAKAAQAAAS